MIKIKNLAARTLTSLMVATTLSVTMPFSTVFAAPATDYVYFAAADTADEEVETVIKAIETYKRTGNKSDLDKVNALISKLSSKKLIKLYVYLSKDLYLKNYLTKGFLYFDVDKYLANNADVRISASLHKITDIRKYALEHYLTLGIYEGRKSETSFDPARAVLNSPELLTHFIQGQKEKPTEADLPLFVRQEYGEKTGKTTTADLDENGQVKTVTPHNDPAPTQNSNSNAGSSEGSGQGDEEGQKEPEKPEDKYRTPVFRNNDSNIITPYTLYDFEKKNKNFDFTIEDRPNYPRGYNDVTVMFFGENVELAQKLAGQRKFTLMQYMCGTDLEGESRAVSNEISTMLQAGSSDNMNILIFLGGTKDYGASYLNDDLSGLRAGIYYLNMAGLSKEVKEKLRAIPFIENTAEVTKILEGKAQDKENICKGLKYEDIINDQTLIQLAAISEIDMTDPSLLAGFINFGTELFPADRYGLTLNNHGGGYEGGIISTEQLEKDGSIEINKSNISADKLESALASTLLFRDKSMSDDGKFSFIYYDACLMGAVEQAYNMRDYSKFMIGAEEVGLGTSDYRFAIENVNKLLGEDGTDRAIAIEIAKAYIDESLHTGTKDGMIGSAAVFSTDAIDDTFTKINTLARDFSYVLGDNICSDTFRNDIFKAIRLAAFSSYKTGNAGEGGTDFKEMYTDIRSIDIGDFYNYLKINMMGVENSAETYSAQDKEVLGRINRELDDVLDAGFLVYLNTKTFEDFGAVTKTDYEGIIPLNYAVDTKKDVWSDVRGKDSGIRVFPYGASMVFSYGENGDAFKTQYLYHAVKGKGMEDYANFLVDFLKFNEDPEGYEKQKQALAKEMMDKNLYTKLITQEEGNNGYTTTLTDENNKTYTYVSFKIADSYEAAGLTAPENSTGSPMLDIMDTQDGIWLTGVHKEYFDYKDSKEGDGRLSVDMICAEKRIKHYSIAPGSNTVYFDVSQTTSSITEAFALFGKKYDLTTGKAGKEDWQFVLLSALESDKNEKKKAAAVFSSDEDLWEKTVSFSGSVLMEDNKSLTNAYHFFSSDVGDYKYMGSVLKKGDQYVNVSDGGVAISAYHYVLREEKDGENVVRTYKEQLEGHDGFTDGYYSLSDNSINLTSMYIAEQDPDTGEYSALSTAYMLNIGGTGRDYSPIAYIDNSKIYDSGNNIGNGQLGVIDMDKADSAFVNSIGSKITDPDKNNGDTEVPEKYVEEKMPFIKSAAEADGQATAGSEGTAATNTEAEGQEAPGREDAANSGAAPAATTTAASGTEAVAAGQDVSADDGEAPAVTAAAPSGIEEESGSEGTEANSAGADGQTTSGGEEAADSSSAAAEQGAADDGEAPAVTTTAPAAGQDAANDGDTSAVTTTAPAAGQDAANDGDTSALTTTALSGTEAAPGSEDAEANNTEAAPGSEDAEANNAEAAGNSGNPEASAPAASSDPAPATQAPAAETPAAPADTTPSDPVQTAPAVETPVEPAQEAPAETPAETPESHNT